MAEGKLDALPLTAVGRRGVVRGWSTAAPLLDLDYSEDSTAEVDANVVMTGDGGLVEVQATAERTPLSRASLDELLALPRPTGSRELRAAQEEAVAAAAGAAEPPCGSSSPPATSTSCASWRSSCARTSSIRCPEDVELPPETGTTFADNALGKARAAAARDRAARRSPTTPESRPRPSTARPGVWSARYAGEDATDEENLAKLLQRGPGGRRPPGGVRLRARLRRARRARGGRARALRGQARPRAARRRRLRLRPRLRARRLPRRRAHDGRARRRTRRTRSAIAAARRARWRSGCSRPRRPSGREPAALAPRRHGRAPPPETRERRRTRRPSGRRQRAAAPRC